MYWVSVRCEFQCRACGHLSPLNFLDLDGSVRCLRCGLDQAFARASWEQVLEHAHSVGDLAGSAEGREPHALYSIAGENPFAAVRSARHTQSGFVTERGMQIPTSVQLQADLDPPTCDGCQSALIIQRGGPGEVRTTCSRCSATRSYQLPAEAPKIAPGIVGVIASEHRSDCPATRVQDDVARPGAIAVLCPACGGQLSPTRDSPFATCGFCRTTSRIPQKTLFRVGGEMAKPERFWLAFQGPSLLRKKLERDPSVPTDVAIAAREAKLQVAPKRKKPAPADVALVVVLPLLVLVAVAVVDLLILGALELDLPF